jgi:hypothetical protein
MARGRKNKGKTGHQSKGGGDDNVGLDVPNHNETNSGDGNDNVLDENRNNEGGNEVCNYANNVGKSSDGDNGDGDNTDGIVNNNCGNDSNDVGYPPDSGDAVRERKKKGKTVQQSKGGGDNNCGLDGPNHNETNSGDGNDDVLGGNGKKKEANMLAMTPMLLANLLMVTMVMVTTVMALLTVLVAMTAIMLVTRLSVVTLSVKEKRK